MSATTENDARDLGHEITLTIGGKVYGDWMEMSVERAIDRMKSAFTIGVNDRRTSSTQLWQITPFSACTVAIGKDVVLTGYVEAYEGEIDARSHRVTVTGGSQTMDLVDCSPDIPSGQFKGYTLEQIARAICKPFGINVVVQTNATQVFPDATIQRTEKCFAFLERLGRLAGVLLTDDEHGNLVLTTAGSTRATSAIVQGQNLLRGTCKLDASKRFSRYVVKGQTAIGSASSNWGGAGGFGSPGGAVPAAVVTNLQAVATDSGVPRYRPHTGMAEAQLDAAGMQRRATWERNYAQGRATSARLTVSGWRQADGTLWKENTIVSVTAPFAQIDQDLLIARVRYTVSPTTGKRTELEVGPISGYTPDPGQVKTPHRKGKKGKTAPDWDGAGNS